MCDTTGKVLNIATRKETHIKSFESVATLPLICSTEV